MKDKYASLPAAKRALFEALDHAHMLGCQETMFRIASAIEKHLCGRSDGIPMDEIIGLVEALRMMARDHQHTIAAYQAKVKKHMREERSRTS